MITTIKHEPTDCDEECYNNPFNQIDLSSFIKSNEKLINQFTLDDILTNTYDDIDLNIEVLTNELIDQGSSSSSSKYKNNETSNEFKIENIFKKLVNTNTNQIAARSVKNEIKFKNYEDLNYKKKSQKRKLNMIQKQQQQINDFKEAFISNDSSSSSTMTSSTTATISTTQSTFESLKCDYDSMNIAGESMLLNKLNCVLNNEENDKKLPIHLKYALTRFKCKLNLRRLKRLKRLKLFDIDAYTNELIDSEKSRKQIANDEDKKEQKQHLQITNIGTSSNDVEVIAVYRVLDRFNKFKKCDQFGYSLDLSFKIGLIEYRNDDIKCIVSPFTKK